MIDICQSILEQELEQKDSKSNERTGNKYVYFLSLRILSKTFLYFTKIDDVSTISHISRYFIFNRIYTSYKMEFISIFIFVKAFIIVAANFR